jgi:molybdenum cofactor biosynthesis protein B
MASETTAAHKKKSPNNVRISVITISDSKYTYHWTGKDGVETEDVSGKSIISKLKEAGHELVFYCIIPDHEEMIIDTVEHIIATYSPDAIVTTGGTGIGPRDVTIEAVESVFEKSLSGFGELFRQISLREVGNAAMLSRATAGLLNGVVIFCLPGSPNACETGIGLILEEIRHVVKHAKEN